MAWSDNLEAFGVNGMEWNELDWIRLDWIVVV